MWQHWKEKESPQGEEQKNTFFTFKAKKIKSKIIIKNKHKICISLRCSSSSLEETWMVSANTVNSAGRGMGLDSMFLFQQWDSERGSAVSVSTTRRRAWIKSSLWQPMSWDGRPESMENKYIHENIFTNTRWWMRAEHHQLLWPRRQRHKDNLLLHCLEK